MTEWMPVTYYPDLVSVTETRARFEGPDFSVELPSDQWVFMGRPSRIAYTPHAVISNALKRSARTDLASEYDRTLNPENEGTND